MDVATDRSASSREIREASWARALTRRAGRGQGARTARPTKKHLAALEMLEQVGDQVFGFCMSVAFA